MPPHHRLLEAGLPFWWFAVAALDERRPFWPKSGGHKPPLQMHLSALGSR